MHVVNVWGPQVCNAPAADLHSLGPNRVIRTLAYESQCRQQRKFKHGMSVIPEEHCSNSSMLTAANHLLLVIRTSTASKHCMAMRWCSGYVVSCWQAKLLGQLQAAQLPKGSMDRLLLVAAFAQSGFAAGLRPYKCLNPVAGETFEVRHQPSMHPVTHVMSYPCTALDDTASKAEAAKQL